MTSQTYHFLLILAGCDEVVNDIGGEVIIDFDREGPSLRETVQSAIQQIEQAGCRVAEVRPEGYSIFQELNQQLANH